MHLTRDQVSKLLLGGVCDKFELTHNLWRLKCSSQAQNRVVRGHLLSGGHYGRLCSWTRSEFHTTTSIHLLVYWWPLGFESATICQQTAMHLLLSVTQLVHWGQVAGQCRGPFVGAGVMHGWSPVNHKDNTITDNTQSTKISPTLYIHHHKCV